MSRQALVLFDIDGTLLLTGRAGVRAMTAAFAELFGVPDAFAAVSLGGRTDSYLLSRALADAGLPDTPVVHATFEARYVERLAAEITRPGTGRKGVLPGVPALLDAVRATSHLHAALLTGNYRAAAHIKLSHFGLSDHFSWGAFSDDAADRNALVPIARNRARERGILPDTTARTIVVGDTPYDVECARVAGARAIAVATGGFGADELRAAGADVVLEDLTETEAVLELLI